MGFGTLFFGYFILLDLPYQTLTNVCAAALMLLGLYKLSYLNVNMKRSFYICMGFLLFAGYEAVIEVLDLVFDINISGVVLNTVSYILRNVIIGALTVFMLFGMRDVADEVGLKRLAKKCDIYSKITFAVYILNLCIPPDFVTFFGGGRTVTYIAFLMSVITTLFTLYVILMNVFNIYSCYTEICMPEDKSGEDAPPKKSRFGFINRFREHEEEKRREYAEYKSEKMKKRAEKRKNKKK